MMIYVKIGKHLAKFQNHWVCLRHATGGGKQVAERSTRWVTT
jgi:hypothetical protein